MVDCLDQERSELRRDDEEGYIDRVYTFCFKPGMLEGKHIFRLPPRSGRERLIDDGFRECVETNGLKGLLFKELPMIE